MFRAAINMSYQRLVIKKKVKNNFDAKMCDYKAYGGILKV